MRADEYSGGASSFVDLAQLVPWNLHQGKYRKNIDMAGRLVGWWVGWLVPILLYTSGYSRKGGSGAFQSQEWTSFASRGRAHIEEYVQSK